MARSGNLFIFIPWIFNWLYYSFSPILMMMDSSGFLSFVFLFGDVGLLQFMLPCDQPCRYLLVSVYMPILSLRVWRTVASQKPKRQIWFFFFKNCIFKDRTIPKGLTSFVKGKTKKEDRSKAKSVLWSSCLCWALRIEFAFKMLKFV